MFSKTKDYDFNITPNHQSPEKSLKENASNGSLASQDSESVAAGRESSVENEEVVIESQSFVKLRIQLLENLFSNGYMPNHSFSIDGRNFDFHDGMYYY